MKPALAVALIVSSLSVAAPAEAGKFSDLAFAAPRRLYQKAEKASAAGKMKRAFFYRRAAAASIGLVVNVPHVLILSALALKDPAQAASLWPMSATSLAAGWALGEIIVSAPVQ